MSSLNYLRIAQLLEGTLTKAEAPVFGGFSVAQTALERFRLIQDVEEAAGDIVPKSQFADIAAAFEKVRQGYELDRVLVDPVISKQLVAECRKYGVTASPRAIFKRLQQFRKAPPPGIRLAKTTRDAGIVAEPFFYAAELACTQLSYRHNVSVDDIVTDPEVGREFDSICKDINARGDSLTFKWAALRLRKMRTFPKKKTQTLLEIKPEQIEAKLEDAGTLDELDPSRFPERDGLFSFAELDGQPQYLYVGSAKSVRDGVAPFADAKPFKAIAGEFWLPDLSRISVRYAVADQKRKLLGSSPRDLGMRLIQERHPVFNLPVEMELEEAA